MTHAPVMLDEALNALQPRYGGVYVDGTFGAGGYSRAILGAAECEVIAFDRDPSVRPAAEALAAEFDGRFQLIEAPFADMADALRRAGAEGVDGVVLDIGVSSMQIDQAERGFSFRFDGPLDMRMSAHGLTAAEAVAAMDVKDLTRIFRALGEENRARRAAEAIVSARVRAPVDTTAKLADIVRAAVGKAPGAKIDPATRVFQALRMFVNDELGQLLEGLQAAERVLAEGGRLAVVSFHSLEDRIVKQFLRRRSGGEVSVSRHAPAPAEPQTAPSFSLPGKKAITPGSAEVEANPRARSAKLRVGVRTGAPAWPAEDDDLLPRAPRIVEWELAS